MLQGPIPPAHIFDMNYFDGKLWAVGSQQSSFEINVPPFSNDGDATVWSSSDNGNSWEVSLDIQQIDNCCARVYFSGVQGGKLYVQAEDFDEFHPTSMVYDGTSWTEGPNLLVFGGGRDANPFKEKLVMLQFSSLVSFDGDRVTRNYSNVVDYTISDDFVYVLTSQKEVYRSSDLINWRLIDSIELDADIHSIEVKNLIVYVGTSDSKVYKSEVLVPCEENCTGFLNSIYKILELF